MQLFIAKSDVHSKECSQALPHLLKEDSTNNQMKSKQTAPTPRIPEMEFHSELQLSHSSCHLAIECSTTVKLMSEFSSGSIAISSLHLSLRFNCLHL